MWEKSGVTSIGLGYADPSAGSRVCSTEACLCCETRLFRSGARSLFRLLRSARAAPALAAAAAASARAFVTALVLDSAGVTACRFLRHLASSWPISATVAGLFQRLLCSPLVLKEQIGYVVIRKAGLGRQGMQH